MATNPTNLPPPEQPPQFSPAQQQILTLLAEGYSVTSAADLLGISRGTVYYWCRNTPGFDFARQEHREEACSLNREELLLTTTDSLRHLESLVSSAKPATRLRAILAALKLRPRTGSAFEALCYATETAIDVRPTEPDPAPPWVDPDPEGTEIVLRRMAMHEEMERTTARREGRRPDPPEREPRFHPEPGTCRYDTAVTEAVFHLTQTGRARDADRYDFQGYIRRSPDAPDLTNCTLNPKQRNVVQALAGGANISQATEAARVGRRTYYLWMKTNPEFNAAVLHAKDTAASRFRDRTRHLARKSLRALRELINDPATPERTRLTACIAALNFNPHPGSTLDSILYASDAVATSPAIPELFAGNSDFRAELARQRFQALQTRRVKATQYDYPECDPLPTPKRPQPQPQPTGPGEAA